MKRIRLFLSLFGQAAQAFIHDNAFKLSAALSYYTVFALGPLLIIIISLADIFLRRDAIEGKVYLQLNGLVGHEAALQLQEIIRNIQSTQSTTSGAIVGGIILIIGATGVFTEMQDSINFIWSVRAKPKKSWLKFLTNRLLSFSLVVGLGFILLVSLAVNALLNLLSDRLTRVFPDYTVYVFSWVNALIILVVITGLFAVIFKVLPDAIISWRDALVGAIVTALFFLLGKFGIGFYLEHSNLNVTYGAAASIIIIITWIYYSALILYYGAEFTKMYALQAGAGIRPKETAVFIIKRESREVPTSYLDT